MGNINKRVLKPKEQFSHEDKVTCNNFGCGKQLTPTEYLYSIYCFSCQIKINEMKKKQMHLFEKAQFACTLFKWNSNTNVWDKQRSFEITFEQANSIEGETVTALNQFYRYDIFLDNAIYKSVYHYSPNKLD